MAIRARLGTILCLALLAVALPLRLWLVSTWHAPAGDGIDYFQLSQELTRANRFAYGPPPMPESYSRMPGYPLFLAYAAVRKAPVGLGTHLLRATRANVFLDVGTAFLVLLLLRECERGTRKSGRLGLGRAAPLFGFGLALFYPLQMLLSAYGLSESLSTFLATLEMYLALRAMRTRLLLHAILCGLLAGAAQLVRMDAVVAAPAVMLAIASADAPLRRRLLAAGLFVAVASGVFAPWPLRNLRLFGQAHVSGAYLRLRDSGDPLPDGVISWMRTWATGAPGESVIDLALSMRLPMNPNRFATATFDQPAERYQLTDILTRYNQEGLSPRVDADFRQLGRQRFARHPLRVLLLLPLLRLQRLWTPLPDSELPMRVSQLKLPERRWLFGYVDRLLYGLTLVGMIAFWRRGAGGRRRLGIFGIALLGRSLLYAFAVPNAVNQRFLAEGMPLLFVLGAAGICALGALDEGASPATASDTALRHQDS